MKNRSKNFLSIIIHTLIIFSLQIFITSCNDEETALLEKSLENAKLSENFLPKEVENKIKETFPNFKYSFVEVDHGNVKSKAGDKEILIEGVEEVVAKEKLGYMIQKIYFEKEAMISGDYKMKKRRKSGNGPIDIETFTKKIKSKYPDFTYSYVDENESNVKRNFNGKFLKIEGIDEEKTREKVAAFLLENQAKKVRMRKSK